MQHITILGERQHSYTNVHILIGRLHHHPESIIRVEGPVSNESVIPKQTAPSVRGWDLRVGVDRRRRGT